MNMHMCSMKYYVDPVYNLNFYLSSYNSHHPRKSTFFKRKISKQQEAIAILEWQLQRSNGGWDFWYHKAQEYKEKINSETEEETDSSNDDEILDAIE